MVISNSLRWIMQNVIFVVLIKFVIKETVLLTASIKLARIRFSPGSFCPGLVLIIMPIIVYHIPEDCPGLRSFRLEVSMIVPKILLVLDFLYTFLLITRKSTFYT